MLYAFDHLYMMGNRSFSRAKVLPNGELGPTEFLCEMAGGGEHGPHSIIVTGHSHMPGKVPFGAGRFYINTGSWTFRSTTYAHWDGQEFTVQDWLRKKIYDDRLYRPLLDRRWRHMDMMAWWRSNYMGWFRFRAGETGHRYSVTPSVDKE